MCNKKERKRDRRWYLFPVSTLGAVYFAVHGGTGAGFYFSRRDGAVCLFFSRRDGAVIFFFRGGKRGGCLFFRGETGWLFFFFFDGTGRGGVFFFFEGRDGTVVFGGGNFFGGTGKIVTPSRQPSM